MPDDRTYGFDRDDADALIQSIGNGENWFPEIKPRGGGGGSATNTCPCTCIDEGDLTLDGIQTTTKWRVTLSTVVETQANGSITFPAGTYTVTWDNVLGYWVVNVGDVLTAAYTSGNDATSATTMDADLIFRKNSGGYVTLTLSITGTVPAE